MRRQERAPTLDLATDRGDLIRDRQRSVAALDLLTAGVERTGAVCSQIADAVLSLYTICGQIDRGAGAQCAGSDLRLLTRCGERDRRRCAQRGGTGLNLLTAGVQDHDRL